MTVRNTESSAPRRDAEIMHHQRGRRRERTYRATHGDHHGGSERIPLEGRRRRRSESALRATAPGRRGCGRPGGEACPMPAVCALGRYGQYGPSAGDRAASTGFPASTASRRGRDRRCETTPGGGCARAATAPWHQRASAAQWPSGSAATCGAGGGRRAIPSRTMGTVEWRHKKAYCLLKCPGHGHRRGASGPAPAELRASSESNRAPGELGARFEFKVTESESGWCHR